MSRPDGRVRGVDTLSAVAGSPEHVEFQILGPEFDFKFLNFGKHCDGDCGCVDSPARLRFRNALYPVYAALVFNARINIVAGKREDYFLCPAAAAAWDLMRVIPVCAVTGEAAGTAAALACSQTDGKLKDLNIQDIQAQLLKQGVLIDRNKTAP